MTSPPPPYLDSSCRREPDFEHPFPAITGLCRKGKTASFLVGERVAYFTVGRAHHLTAIFKIEASFSSHEEANTRWYQPHSLRPPRNVIVHGSEPVPYEVTCGFYKGENKVIVRPGEGRDPVQLVQEWDGLYRKRMSEAQHVHVCRVLFVEVEHPPVLTKDGAARVFPGRRFPGTQNPKKENERVIDALAAELCITLRVAAA